MEKSEGCGIVGNVVELEEVEEGTGRPWCRSKYWTHEDQRDQLWQVREGRRDGFNEIREDRRDGFVEIREDREDGFVQTSKRKTCKRLEKTDGTTNVKRSNQFDVLRPTTSGLEVEEVRVS